MENKEEKQTDEQLINKIIFHNSETGESKPELYKHSTVISCMKDYVAAQTSKIQELEKEVKALRNTDEIWSKTVNVLEKQNTRLQKELEELKEKADKYSQALHGVYNLCDGDNQTHELIWRVVDDVLHN